METIITAIVAAAKSVGMAPALLLALCSTESDFRNIVNEFDGGSSSYGVCQIKVETARMLRPNITVMDLMDPRANAETAALYLIWQSRRYNGNLPKAISAYNAGRAIKGNKKYVNKVLTRMEYYERWAGL